MTPLEQIQKDLETFQKQLVEKYPQLCLHIVASLPSKDIKHTDPLGMVQNVHGNAAVVLNMLRSCAFDIIEDTVKETFDNIEAQQNQA